MVQVEPCFNPTLLSVEEWQLEGHSRDTAEELL